MNYWKITDDKKVKTSELIAEAKKMFALYVWDEKDIDKQFPAPKKTQVYYVRKSIESDVEHKGKSYNDLIAEDKKYMDMRQYILLCIQVFKETGKFLDVVGWTRTSSLWRDGRLVYGCWLPDDRGVGVGYGDRDDRDGDYGPRELFLELPSILEPSTLEFVSKQEFEEFKKKVEGMIKI